VGLAISDTTPNQHLNYGTMKCRLSILAGLRNLGVGWAPLT